MVEARTAPQPRLSVVVPHYQDLERLDLCLAALDRQSYPREDFEIVVADNASPVGADAVNAVIAGRARLVVVRQKGAGPARNGGVAASTGANLAFTDSDCQPEPDWLAEGMLALASHDFVGGCMKVLVEDPGAVTSAEAFEQVFAFNNRDYVVRKGFSVTANLFCPRSVFDEVGGFRVGISEDLEWCRRARAAGYNIGYAPLAIVGHPARRTWAELRQKSMRIDAEMFALASAEEHGRLNWLIRSLALPLSALAHTPRVAFSGALHRPRQRLGALVMLYRVRFWRFADSLGLLLGRGAE